MKSLKYHISIILPLFLLLFAVESFHLLKKMIDDYEQKISNDYSVVIVSKIPLDKNSLQKKIAIAKDLVLIKSDKVLMKLNGSINKSSLQKLKNALPLFYSLKLKHLPSEGELLNIKKILQSITGVKKVVVFKKSYNQFYHFLLFERGLLEFFMIFVSVIVLLLIIKQAEVWIFEHKQRFEIMSILGAPFWMKSAMLYRVVVVDSVVSAVLVMSLFFYLSKNREFLSYFTNMGIRFPQVNIVNDSLILLGIGVVISIVSVTFAISKLNKEQ